MARTFRYFEKKRGHRRTGSKTLAIVGETVFFTFFLVGGVAGLFVLYFMLVVPQLQANTEFVAHRCLVLDKRIGEKEGDDGMLYRPEIQIEYSIQGERFVVWTYDIWIFDATGGYSAGREENQRILDRFEVGREYVCWYDPQDPSRVVLVRAYRWWLGLLFILPVSFILIGAGRLVYLLLLAGKSAECRSAFTQKAARLAPFEEKGSGAADFPAIPAGVNLTDSPGTALAFRLPAAATPSVALGTTLAAAVIWNGIVAWLLVVSVRGHMRGQPDWPLTVFSLIFAAVGLVLVAWAARHAMVATGVGPTLLEISDQPLRPGGRYQLFVSQTGRLRLRCFEVLLACEEEATYRHGTDTRKELCRVLEQPVFRRDDFDPGRPAPFAASCEVQMPERAMHSFQSAHNEVNWRFIVRGKIAGWPDYERSFPVLVYPSEDGKEGR